MASNSVWLVWVKFAGRWELRHFYRTKKGAEALTQSLTRAGFRVVHITHVTFDPPADEEQEAPVAHAKGGA
jgi:ribosomal protein S11